MRTTCSKKSYTHVAVISVYFESKLPRSRTSKLTKIQNICIIMNYQTVRQTGFHFWVRNTLLGRGSLFNAEHAAAKQQHARPLFTCFSYYLFSRAFRLYCGRASAEENGSGSCLSSFGSSPKAHCGRFQFWACSLAQIIHSRKIT